MRTILILLVALVSFSANAKTKYHNGEIIYIDGKTKVGLVGMMEDGGDEFIKFKASESAEVEKIESEKLTRIIYKIDDEAYEFHRIKVNVGWKAKVKIKGPGWLQVVQKGYATLYINVIVMSNRDFYGTNSATFKDYYIKRDSDEAAKMIATIASANNNQTFRANGPIFFADYPELAEKIQSKEYTWKDLFDVVDMYNEWATNK
ncbi:MAG: hypothetical protein ABFS32_14335 [Bacteroidota bacterium]